LRFASQIQNEAGGRKVKGEKIPFSSELQGALKLGFLSNPPTAMLGLVNIRSFGRFEDWIRTKLELRVLGNFVKS
jgi:hypothetical protein